MNERVHGIIQVESVLEASKRWGRQQQLAETQTRSFGISGSREKCHRDCPDSQESSLPGQAGLATAAKADRETAQPNQTPSKTSDKQ